MAKSKSSKQWLDEHFSDAYVKQSKQQGYRGRAAYKLIELDKKYQLFKPGMCVVDLGAAPGGWSQVLAQKLGHHGQIVALDILEMEPVAGVEFIKGDFTEEQTYEALMNVIENKTIDWVISDMAPNITGNKTTDQAKSTYLVELAIDFAEQSLNKGGHFLAKAFQGQGFDSLIQTLRSSYNKVSIKKPDASRLRSSEVYILAQNKKHS